jgi:hypothetical protein
MEVERCNQVAQHTIEREKHMADNEVESVRAALERERAAVANDLEAARVSFERERSDLLHQLAEVKALAHQDCEQRIQLQQKLETELSKARYSYDEICRDKTSLG